MTPKTEKPKLDIIIDCPACGESWTDEKYAYSATVEQLEQRVKELEAELQEAKELIGDLTTDVGRLGMKNAEYEIKINVINRNPILKAALEKLSKK